MSGRVLGVFALLLVAGSMALWFRRLDDVALVGVPDPEWGEVICAVVVSDRSVALDALRQFCEGRLAAFKKPRRLECVGELPRTAATGQIQRTLLVERILAGG